MTRVASRAHRPLRHCARGGVLALALSCALAPAAWAASATPVTSPTTPSALDAPLFYQLLIGEIELREGRAGNAFEVILDAAKRQRDGQLYQRAVDIALQARAGEQALSAVRAWRAETPKAVVPLRYESQILLALNRLDDAADPLGQWLAKAPSAERPGLIAGLPRLLQRQPDAQKNLALVERLTRPYRDEPALRVPVLLAQSRAHLLAGGAPRALALARQAQALDAAAAGPALLALELMGKLPEAEHLVQQYVNRPDAEAAVRMAYVRALIQKPSYPAAGAQLERLTQDSPKLAEPWLMLGALRLEMKQIDGAEQALLTYLALAPADAPATGTAASNADSNNSGTAGTDAAAAPAPGLASEETADGPTSSPSAAGLSQAWLLLARAAEQRGDLNAAETWLVRITDPQRQLEVKSRRATLLARQGQLPQARALIQSVAERGPEDARAKLLAEAQLLREMKQWPAAAEWLKSALAQQPEDVDLLYELSMVEEKLGRFDEMERLLRQVIALKPDHPHAHNALGYSMADRNVRLPEARALIERALALSPADPFITDSLGWVAYRMGQFDEAIRLLRQAYAARPDTEIAAHLGEVLWAANQRDEARRVWQSAQTRDADNDVLRDTLARLKVGL